MLTYHRRRSLATLNLIKLNQPVFWLSLSLAFATLYGVWGLQDAFSGEYVVQDDARQHVFWMQRYLDPELFPNDLIADYFQSVAPAGYATLYRLIAEIGISSLLLNKLLPIVLGWITTYYCFQVSLLILPISVTGFMASLLLNQAMWMDDGLTSATPRAFIYPIFLAFMYYLLRRSLFGCVITMALLGWFYPQYLLMSVGLLVFQLVGWRGKLHLSSRRRDYWLCAAGLGVVLLVLLPYVTTASQYGPIITAAEARTWPEFQEDGRASFFDANFWDFWFNNMRSGLLTYRGEHPFLLDAGWLLPILWLFRRRLPLIEKVRGTILLQLSLVSLTLFFAAHAVLFRLHLPSRYTKHSLRIVLALAAAIVLTLLLNAVLSRGRQVFAVGVAALISVILLFYPAFVPEFTKTNYQLGTEPELYKFFAQQPKDSLIASLSTEADNLPSFSERSVLVSKGYAIPYHLGYYRQFRQRVVDLIEAQYSSDIAEVKTFIQKYGIDFWLLEGGAFTSEYLGDRWFQQYQLAATEAQTGLEQSITPALVVLQKSCSVFASENFVVLEANCIVN